MSKCKYRKICPGYQKVSALCDEDGGSWSFDKKCNNWIKFTELKGGKKHGKNNKNY